MRRSAAPSQRAGGFRPPAKVPRTDETPTLATALAAASPTEKCVGDATQNENAAPTGLGAASEPCVNVPSKAAPVVGMKKFVPVFRAPLATANASTGSAPTAARPALAPSTTKPGTSVGTAPKPASTAGSAAMSLAARSLGMDTGAGSAADGDKPRYFSALWCKASKKKHKKWEGDAIAVVKGRTLSVQDLEGKDLGSSTSYGRAELAKVSVGESFFVGGREIEITGVIKDEDYTSGKCFLASSSSAGAPGMLAPTRAKPAAKGLARQGEPMRVEAPVAQAPRHDPTEEGAIVLPRPSDAMVRANSKDGQGGAIDVVVDPYLQRKLRPHQIAGVTFLYECVMGMRQYQGNGAILADEMGLGKTLQCITLVWTLLKQTPYRGRPVARRVLVVCPSSLVGNWQREFKKFLGDERLKTFAVSNEKRPAEFANSPIYPVMVISYEMLRQSIAEIVEIGFDLVVCDEGHRLKNEGAKITQALMSLPCRRRIILTGTPIQNDLQEFFTLVDFCNPGLLGTPSAFRRLYEAPIVASRDPNASEEEKTLGLSRAEELHRVTNMFCLRRLSEVNNKYLPPKSEYVVFCRPAPLQLDLYRHLIGSRLLRSCFDPTTKHSQHLVCITALKKISNSPALIHSAAVDQDNKDEDTSIFSDVLGLLPADLSLTNFQPEHSGKMQVLVELLRQIRENTTERVVIVSHYTQTLDILEAMCEAYSYKCLRLDGSTPGNRRIALVERFNNRHADDFIFLLSSKAGGVGLNLVGASRLVLYDIDWNPANDVQAMARVWRDGQQRRVHIYRLLTTGTIEEKVFQRQVTKQGLSVAVVDDRTAEDDDAEKASGIARMGGSGGTSAVQFTLEDLKDLFTLREKTACDTHELLGCTCLEADDADALAMDMDTGEDNFAPRVGAHIGNHGAARKPSDKSSVKMDQLMAWEHHAAPVRKGSLAESFLADGNYGNAVTFVFKNETNAGEAK